MLAITPIKETNVTHIACPHCGERLPRIGLLKDSKIEGLTFKCRKCGMLWSVKTK
ncbi:MAG: phage terminase large subunit family protein [Clostridia bacterium]|nr:phage terminase large subunit family protein [Clostridia bacterium]